MLLVVLDMHPLHLFRATYITGHSHTISWTFMNPYENAIAFGGVATGNMKAREAATVAGIIK